MTWHKWLIYGLLWLWALNCLGSGLLLLEVGIAFWGILFLALAAGCVYVRFQLSRLKTGAPKKLLILSIIIDVLNFLSLLAFAESSDGQRSAFHCYGHYLYHCELALLLFPGASFYQLIKEDFHALLAVRADDTGSALYLWSE